MARKAGFKIISWTLERSGLLESGEGWYYQSVKNVINNNRDMMEALHVLKKDVGVLGVFSDWPVTVTYYDNCDCLKKNIKEPLSKNLMKKGRVCFF